MHPICSTILVNYAMKMLPNYETTDFEEYFKSVAKIEFSDSVMCRKAIIKIIRKSCDCKYSKQKDDNIWITGQRVELDSVDSDDQLTFDGIMMPFPQKRLELAKSMMKFEINVSDLYEIRPTIVPDGYTKIELFDEGYNLKRPVLYLISENCIRFVEALKQHIKIQEKLQRGHLHLIINERSAKFNKAIDDLIERKNKATFMQKWRSSPTTTMMTRLAGVIDTLMNPIEIEHSFADKKNMDRRHVTEPISTQVEDEYQYISHPVRLPARVRIPRGEPLSVQQWLDHVSESGAICDEESVKRIIFSGGIVPELRKTVWKYLLGMYQWSWTKEQCEQKQLDFEQRYLRLREQWQLVDEDQASRWTDFRKYKDLIEKDVARTDRTHSYYEGAENANLTLLSCLLMTYMMYHFDLGYLFCIGYVQGMSDLLSPLLMIFEDEVDAFWAFVHFMEKSGTNFELNQSSIKSQFCQLRCLLDVVNPRLSEYLKSKDSGEMFFCFRWLLVLFKREFTFDDIFRLWEVLWTGLPCSNFHLLICLAILEMQTDEIIQRGCGLEDIVKKRIFHYFMRFKISVLVNMLAFKIPLDEVLVIANGIYHQLETVQEKDKVVANISIILGFEAAENPV
ncbi:TBC1 domain family member 15 [Trichinella murrelli]|uniref:TBC1 domain family member 15 n=1 Tax=Trichinella murrelli TaxID=144512 RepID=A0A0V0U493_9BILA|nr:TBC1 domain family member 15 [Trichinella murrelli]